MKHVSRRHFLASSAQAAAGVGIAGCNSRIITGLDKRLPSAPEGLFVSVEYGDNQKIKTKVSWKKHDGSDVTGTSFQNQIKGYNIYCDAIKLNENLCKETEFIDTRGPDNTGIKEGATYNYRVSAVDENDNESPQSILFPTRIQKPSTIYRVVNEKAIISQSSPLKFDKEIIRTMIFTGVKQLTAQSEVNKAFESLFPGLSEKSIIAIKVNTLAGSKLSTHPDVVSGIIDGLATMLDEQFPRKNIVVFDDRMKSSMISAGFSPQSPDNDHQIISTYGETSDKGEKNWSDTIVDIAGSKQQFSCIVEKADYLINVPVLKDHANAGITFALKNFFGIISKPQNMHNGMCDPYIGHVYKFMKNKVKLIIGDALLAAHSGGPNANPTFMPKSILFGTDPVAMDMYALRIINTYRLSKSIKEIGLQPDPSSKYSDARHIETASSTQCDIGSKNYKVIDITL